jgi:hypothetical protein
VPTTRVSGRDNKLSIVSGSDRLDVAIRRLY